MITITDAQQARIRAACDLIKNKLGGNHTYWLHDDWVGFRFDFSVKINLTYAEILPNLVAPDYSTQSSQDALEIIAMIHNKMAELNKKLLPVESWLCQ